jgi:hypothetical protein
VSSNHYYLYLYSTQANPKVQQADERLPLKGATKIACYNLVANIGIDLQSSLALLQKKTDEDIDVEGSQNSKHLSRTWKCPLHQPLPEPSLYNDQTICTKLSTKRMLLDFETRELALQSNKPSMRCQPKELQPY